MKILLHLLFVSTVLLSGCSYPLEDIATSSGEPSTYIAEGELVPDFDFETLEGKKCKLSDFRGKYVFLDFYCARFGVCERRNLLLKQLYSELGDKIIFLSVSVGTRKDVVEKIITENNMTWRQAWIPEEKGRGAMRMLSVDTLPLFHFIDPEGHMVCRDVREHDYETTLRLLKQEIGKEKHVSARAPLGKLWGQVLDEDEKPIANAKIRLIAWGETDDRNQFTKRIAALELYTDEKGIWRFEKMFPEAYRIMGSVYHQNYIERKISKMAGFDLFGRNEIAKAYANGVTTTLRRGVPVRLRITDVDGRLASGQEVFSTIEDYLSGSTDENGNYYVALGFPTEIRGRKHMPFFLGRLFMTVFFRKSYPYSFAARTETSWGYASFYLSKPLCNALFNVEMRMYPFFEYKIIVQDENGKPLEGVFVDETGSLLLRKSYFYRMMDRGGGLCSEWYRQPSRCCDVWNRYDRQNVTDRNGVFVVKGPKPDHLENGMGFGMAVNLRKVGYKEACLLLKSGVNYIKLLPDTGE